MLDKLGWLSLNQMSAEARLIEVWKALNIEDYSLKDIFQKAESGQTNVRSSDKNRVKTTFKSKLRENSFHYPSARLWNSAPTEVTKAITESAARNGPHPTHLNKLRSNCSDFNNIS